MAFVAVQLSHYAKELRQTSQSILCATISPRRRNVFDVFLLRHGPSLHDAEAGKLRRFSVASQRYYDTDEVSRFPYRGVRIQAWMLLAQRAQGRLLSGAAVHSAQCLLLVKLPSSAEEDREVLSESRHASPSREMSLWSLRKRHATHRSQGRFTLLEGQFAEEVWRAAHTVSGGKAELPTRVRLTISNTSPKKSQTLRLRLPPWYSRDFLFVVYSMSSLTLALASHPPRRKRSEDNLVYWQIAACHVQCRYFPAKSKCIWCSKAHHFPDATSRGA